MWASDWSTLSVLCHYSHLVRCGKFAAATLRT